MLTRTRPWDSPKFVYASQLDIYGSAVNKAPCGTGGLPMCVRVRNFGEINKCIASVR